VAEPTPEDLRWSRIAAVVMVVAGALVLLLGRLSSDERFVALGFVVGAPTLAIGALALAYTRIGPHVPNLRGWRERWRAEREERTP
jgi:hypothetical protein